MYVLIMKCTCLEGSTGRGAGLKQLFVLFLLLRGKGGFIFYCTTGHLFTEYLLVRRKYVAINLYSNSCSVYSKKQQTKTKI